MTRRSRSRSRSSVSASTPSKTRSATSSQREVAHPPQHVVQLVAPGGARHLRTVLQVFLHTRERARVDQLAQLLLAEQLAQQLAVERQRRRATLGDGRVALVHVRGDVVEQQRGGERRRGLRLDLHERDLARGQAAQQLLQAGHVEHVLQALAVGLEHDREVVVAARDLQQVLGLQALLPQRRAPAGVGARDQQRAGGVLAKARAEQRRAAELRGDRPLDARRARAGRGRDRCPPTPRVDRGASSAPSSAVEVGQVQHDAVVGPDRRRPPGRGARGCCAEMARPQAACTRPPYGREHAQAPIADLVAEALEHDRAVARQHARGGLLLAQVGDEVARGALVEVVVALQRLRLLIDRPARERADRRARARCGRPTESPFQKGTAPGAPGAGVTITRSRVISSIRQVEAPSRNACPGRAS